MGRNDNKMLVKILFVANLGLILAIIPLIPRLSHSS